ncbi:DUF2637 domain-containing protein [Streptomyces sp. NPDC001205]
MDMEQSADATAGQPDPRWTMPAISRFEWAVLALVGLGAMAVGAIGLYSSYANVTEHMRSKGFTHPGLVPISVDIAIPVFGLAYLLLIRLNMPLAWVRLVPYALTAVTIYLNVTSTTELDSQIAHAVLPALWVIFTEVVAHFYRVQIGRATGTRTDPVPLTAWLLSPFSTLKLWRHMKLWEITSYKTALQLKARRIRAVTALRDRYGFFWRFKAPLDLRSELTLGALTATEVRHVHAGGQLEREDTLSIDLPRGPAQISPAPAQRQLQNPDVQTALPMGVQAASVEPEGDTPYAAADFTVSRNTEAETTLGLDGPTQPRRTPNPAHEAQHGTAVLVETQTERTQREEREQLDHANRRQANYEKAVEVVQELVSLGETVNGPRVAQDDRVPVGARTIQRYFEQMKKDGVLPHDFEQ